MKPCEGEILQRTPLSFPHHTLSLFPSFIKQYLERHQCPNQRDNLPMWVEEEFNHFTQISHNEVSIYFYVVI